MTTGLFVPSDLQARAKWSTGLYKLDASDASDGKDSHSGITVAQVLLFLLWKMMNVKSDVLAVDGLGVALLITD